VICDATPEQQQAMDDLFASIGAGDYDEQLGQISAEAFATG
jgi:hypothetical protein